MQAIYLFLILMSRTRSYFELKQLETFIERFQYLELRGVLGESTFGFDRWVNQRFYKSHEWLSVREHVIVRDNGCDLGVLGYEINGGLLVHHMNPLGLKDLIDGGDWILDPEFLITTSLRTHNAIHYGNEELLPRAPVERKLGDTTLW